MDYKNAEMISTEMKTAITQLNCPVCGYMEIQGNTCPNCDTDVSLIRMLQQLPQTEKTRRQVKVAGWQLAFTGVILVIGMGLGALGCFLFLQPQIFTSSSPSPVVINSRQNNSKFTIQNALIKDPTNEYDRM